MSDEWSVSFIAQGKLLFYNYLFAILNVDALGWILYEATLQVIAPGLGGTGSYGGGENTGRVGRYVELVII